MDEARITTETELDAAISTQRAKKIERLTRMANMSYFWFMLLPTAAIACFVVAYATDRKWVSLSGIGLLVASTITGYFQVRDQREMAAADLAEELRKNAQRPSNVSLQRDRTG
jgi:hypothetical protein